MNTDADDDSVIKQSQQKGVAVLYFIFSGFCVAFLLFLEFFVPETKGKSPQDLLPPMAIAKVPLLSEIEP